jgi:glyoxylase-like metal-dependent hydrolase (beta-lactamase superfamily II)
VTESTLITELHGLRVEQLVTSGTFELDGGSWAVDNNVWIIGDDKEVVVIDAPHDAEAIVTAVGSRHVTAVMCTHAHNDHINAAAELGYALHAPVLLHPADEMLWNGIHPEFAFMRLHDQQRIGFAGTDLIALHTPGHSPGSTCLHLPDIAALFSGDTLFEGGPGATGRSYSDFPTIIESVREKVLTLPADTTVYTGHGATTRVGAEAPHLEDWIARGH